MKFKQIIDVEVNDASKCLFIFVNKRNNFTVLLIEFK